jgi:glycosyltransferase involved in cell wall biosynthesis
LKICLVAPPFLPVPPARYGGTERVIATLATELSHRGHDVTVFGAGDSSVPTKIVAVVPQALWSTGWRGDGTEWYHRTADLVLEHADEFDLVHSHIDGFGFAAARQTQTPWLTTLHGRLDEGPIVQHLAEHPEASLVAISANQRRQAPAANWLATIHHGLDLTGAPLGEGSGEYLVFVGRLAPDKGVDDAIEVARRAGKRLVIAAKAAEEEETEVYDSHVAPAIDEGIARFVGEVGGNARDRLFADALATLMMGGWPEPFGLVAIESLASGTPVIARRAGALPEIVVDGTDGFIVDSVEEGAARVARVAALDRPEIRRRTLRRFAAERMVDEYEQVYLTLAGSPRDARSERESRTEVGSAVT